MVPLYCSTGQSRDSAACWLWVRLTIAKGSWVSTLLLTLSAQLSWATPPGSPLTQQGFAESSLLWLSRGSWVWLSLSWHQLLPPTQQGFAEPQPQVTFHQLSKGLLSRSYYSMTSADSAESKQIQYVQHRGLSNRVTEPPPQAQQGFAEPTLDLCTTLELSRRTESRSH